MGTSTSVEARLWTPLSFLEVSFLYLSAIYCRIKTKLRAGEELRPCP